ncbi:DUF2264 domain-containing protein [Paenibacillus apiarius]|uniref:DUF2264 domain-containing protein n=1 Tax=Paenibacillus apiarius TaxID=46240 RepID=UPI003B3A3793
MNRDSQNSMVPTEGSDKYAGQRTGEEPGAQERLYWLELLNRIARPVLTALAERRLKLDMPIESHGGEREHYAYLEAFGRLMAGIAPWLGSDGGIEVEKLLRLELRKLYEEAMDAATDPHSPDCLNFADGYQPIVDTAFLCQGVLRAPQALWDPLSERVKSNVIAAWKVTRSRKPHYNNWLLFSAMIEAALYYVGEADWDPMRIDYALKQHEQWYVGDGVYGDGPAYHADYYNSFVIQPMLLDVLRLLGDLYPDWNAMKPTAIRRAQGYAAQQERMISPEGTIPPIGRSLAYRCGVLQTLAQIAWLDELPAPLVPSQVRCAMTAVMRRMMDAPGTYTPDGWLTVGFCGHQPGIGETYISTGSLYLCSTALMPLALSPAHSFWQGETEWTSKKAWSGEPFAIDYALHD